MSSPKEDWSIRVNRFSSPSRQPDGTEQWRYKSLERLPDCNRTTYTFLAEDRSDDKYFITTASVDTPIGTSRLHLNEMVLNAMIAEADKNGWRITDRDWEWQKFLEQQAAFDKAELENRT